MHKIIDIMNDNNFAVRIINPKVESFKDNWCSYPSFTWTDMPIYIRRIQRTGNSTCYITYATLQDSAYKGQYVPNDFKVTPLVGEDKAKFDIALADWLWKEGVSTIGLSMYTGNSLEFFVEDGAGNIVDPSTFLTAKATATTKSQNGHVLHYKEFKARGQVPYGGCLDSHTYSFHAVLKGIISYARTKYPNAILSPRSLVSIPQSIRDKAGKCLLFTNDSENVYGLKPEVLDPTSDLRPANGNIHWSNFGPVVKGPVLPQVIKSLDAILGVASVSMFAGIDDPARRRFTGLAGDYKEFSSGFQYRVLSNAWALHPLIQHMTLDLGRKAIAFGQAGFMPRWRATEQETISCINNTDVELARDILSRNRDIMLRIINATYRRGEDNAAMALSVFLNGIGSVLKDPLNVNNNWRLQNPTPDIDVSHGYRWANAIPKIINDDKV